ncbi:MAG: response regulator transcription factor [Candidatus Omnitrophica bacterium]|nr:response regulator transcription factor [Candidatus Omnitrophota bacterium]
MAKINIILIDDHEIFLQGLISLLNKRKEFHIVGYTHKGQELLKLLKNERCDLLITDLCMSDIDGMEVIKEVKAKYKTIKILVLTMLKDHEHFKHAMSFGASGYLLKDDAFEQLTTAIRKVMQGKQFVSPAVATLLTDRYLRTIEEVDLPSLDILTNRERQVLKLIAEGQANKNIAANLKLSIRTVETHRINLSNKLGIKNTAGLVKYALAKGLIS